MERVSVSSSNIKSVGHDKISRTLEVEFNSGAVYQYFNVGQSVYDEMIDAGSVGQYFNANVKDNYNVSKV